MNDENLKRLTPSEAREYGKKGGHRSGEVRRQKKAIKETAELILSIPLSNNALVELDDINSLEELKDANVDTITAIISNLVYKALKGNTKAVEILLTLTGDYSKSVKVDTIPNDNSRELMEEYFKRHSNKTDAE